MCVCVCMNGGHTCEDSNLHVCECTMCVGEGQRLMSGVFISLHLKYQGKVSYLSLELTNVEVYVLPGPAAIQSQVNT